MNISFTALATIHQKSMTFKSNIALTMMFKLFGSIFLFVLPPLERPLRVDYIRYVCASLLIIFVGRGKALSRHRTNRKTDRQAGRQTDRQTDHLRREGYEYITVLRRTLAYAGHCIVPIIEQPGVYKSLM